MQQSVSTSMRMESYQSTRPPARTLSVSSSSIADVKILLPKVFTDLRGSLSETYNDESFAEHLGGIQFIQDNQSISRSIGTVRGLHYQAPPFAQHKLVRVASGAILDVAVDLRRSSPTFGKWACATLSAKNMQQMFVPAGFAHGFCTIEPDTVVVYKVSARYSPDHEYGVAWNDPDLAIAWPRLSKGITLSLKDEALPGLSSLACHFE